MSTAKHTGPHPAEIKNAVARRKLEAAAVALADALEAPQFCQRCRCSFGAFCEKHSEQRDAALRAAGRLP